MPATRLPFNSIFKVSGERIVPQVHVAIGNITFAARVPIPSTLVVSGTELKQLTRCDLVVEIEESLIMIIGFSLSDDQPDSGH